MILAYYSLLFSLLVYSYVLVDPNITLINHPLWTTFRNVMVQIGYHQRIFSTFLFICIITLLTFVHIKIQSSKKLDPVRVAIITAAILLLSYPFLSRDMFNYMFDARILTFHGTNPYFHAALDFPQDQWLRFMHWTHRPYPYGPTFLPLTLIPSFLSMGKFILNFILFKGVWVAFYIVGVLVLNKIKRSYALFFATHPLVIIEGLVNMHNDFIAVVFALIAIFYFKARDPSLKTRLHAWFWGLLSIGIKYITAPVGLLLVHQQSSKKIVRVSLVLMACIILYLSYTGEIQQWYFLNFLVFIPFLYKLLQKFNIFSYGILFSYYPFILYGEWDSIEKLSIKHIIILFAFIINIGYVIYRRLVYEE